MINDNLKKWRRKLNVVQSLAKQLPCWAGNQYGAWTNFNLSVCPLTGKSYRQYSPGGPRLCLTPEGHIAYLGEFRGDRIDELIGWMRRAGKDVSAYEELEAEWQKVFGGVEEL